MASVYQKRGRGTWYLRVKDAAGRWLDVASTAQTKTEARRLAADLERKAERQRLGLEPLPTDCTLNVGQLVEWWLRERCPAASHDREASRTAKECHRDAARRGPRAAPHRGEGRGAPPRARASRCGARVREPCARQAADRVFQGAEGGTLGRTEPDHRDGIAAGSQRIGDDHDRHLWTPRARGPARCREPHRTGSVC